jgi:hypothetical protein
VIAILRAYVPVEQSHNQKQPHNGGELNADHRNMYGHRGNIPAFRKPIGNRTLIQILICDLYYNSGILTSTVGILA